MDGVLGVEAHLRAPSMCLICTTGGMGNQLWIMYPWALVPTLCDHCHCTKHNIVFSLASACLILDRDLHNNGTYWHATVPEHAQNYLDPKENIKTPFKQIIDIQIFAISTI